MNTAYLLTGGNLGNRLENLLSAYGLIEKHCGNITNKSGIYETAAWGLEDQPDFYNQVLELNTSLLPHNLMKQLIMIEELMGRRRTVKMGPRVIDIDILLFNSEIIDTPALTIPHARMHERRFVLEPLAEIAPYAVHPVLQKTVQQLLEECTDPLNVHKIEFSN